MLFDDLESVRQVPMLGFDGMFCFLTRNHAAESRRAGSPTVVRWAVGSNSISESPEGERSVARGGQPRDKQPKISSPVEPVGLKGQL